MVEQAPDYFAAENFIVEKLERELPKDLTYHGLHHTLSVLNAAMQIAEGEKIPDEGDLKLLCIAVLFHDAGFIHVYHGHEDKSCEMASEFLPRFNFKQEQIEKVCGMIEATKLPQRPTNHLECIIADADLDHLGREDFYSVSKTLFEEWKTYFNFNDEKEWNRAQVKFLSEHHYFTSHSIKFREPEKQKRLTEIRKLVNER